MSMVPASEDFERLAVRWASSTAAKEYPNLVAMLSAFPERYAKDRDAPFGTTLGGSERLRAGASAARQGHGKDDAAAQALALLDGTPVGIHGKRRYIEAIHEPVKAHDALTVETSLAVRL